MYRQMKKAILTSYPTDLEIQQSILHNMSFAWNTYYDNYQLKSLLPFQIKI